MSVRHDTHQHYAKVEEHMDEKHRHNYTDYHSHDVMMQILFLPYSDYKIHQNLMVGV